MHTPSRPAEERSPEDFLPKNYPVIHFPDNEWEIFCQRCEPLHIPDPTPFRETFEGIYSHLVGVNEWLNLTRLTSVSDYLKFQLLDSLSIYNIIEPMLEKHSCVMDLGSGGGYPGLPLMTLLTTQDFYLVDSRKKKVDFLNAAITVIPRQGKAGAIACRGREITQHRTDLAHHAEIVTCRAVGKGIDLLEDAAALLALGGVFVLMKGPGWPRDEAEDFQRIAPKFGFEQMDDVVFSLTPEDPEHHIILAVKKEAIRRR